MESDGEHTYAGPNDFCVECGMPAQAEVQHGLTWCPGDPAMMGDLVAHLDAELEQHRERVQDILTRYNAPDFFESSGDGEAA